MKYKYCPECDQLRPWSFRLDDRCDKCREKTVAIRVKHSVFGYAMYVVSAIAAVMIILYVAHRDYNADFTNFMSSINSDVFIAVLFILVVVAFALSFLDLGRTNAEARRIADERKGKWRY